MAGWEWALMLLGGGRSQFCKERLLFHPAFQSEIMYSFRNTPEPCLRLRTPQCWIEGKKVEVAGVEPASGEDMLKPFYMLSRF